VKKKKNWNGKQKKGRKEFWRARRGNGVWEEDWGGSNAQWQKKMGVGLHG